MNVTSVTFPLAVIAMFAFATDHVGVGLIASGLVLLVTWRWMVALSEERKKK